MWWGAVVQKSCISYPFTCVELHRKHFLNWFNTIIHKNDMQSYVDSTQTLFNSFDFIFPKAKWQINNRMCSCDEASLIQICFLYLCIHKYSPAEYPQTLRVIKYDLRISSKQQRLVLESPKGNMWQSVRNTEVGSVRSSLCRRIWKTASVWRQAWHTVCSSYSGVTLLLSWLLHHSTVDMDVTSPVADMPSFWYTFLMITARLWTLKQFLWVTPWLFSTCIMNPIICCSQSTFSICATGWKTHNFS